MRELKYGEGDGGEGRYNEVMVQARNLDPMVVSRSPSQEGDVKMRKVDEG